jgi:ribosome-binding protein aMBF1 (putative translation factor)
LDSFAGDTELQEALGDARKAFSEEVYGDEISLSALRARAGLSQKQLADRMGIKQPYIARIEGGVTDPSTDSIARLAEALGVDEGTAFAAVRFQRKTRGRHDC